MFSPLYETKNPVLRSYLLHSMESRFCIKLNPVKGKSSGARESADELAREARKSHLLVHRNCDALLNGSNGIVSFFSHKGRKGVNQDCLVVWEGFGCQEDMMFCGLFDGHGPWGHCVAKSVRDALPSILLCQWQEALTVATSGLDGDDECFKSHRIFDLWKQSYTRTCALVDMEIDRRQAFYSFSSGTTSVTVIKQGDMLIIANVGDSRAIMGTTSEDGSLVGTQITLDFKPDLPQEAERIRQSKGHVFCLQDEPGVYRVWSPNRETSGLSTSRAFGDHCLKDFGVISTPEVKRWQITDRDQFLVLATDGVWDVLSNQETVDIVASVVRKETSAKRLVECAINSWKCRRPGSAIDDCSAICLFFHSPATSHCKSTE